MAERCQGHRLRRHLLHLTLTLTLTLTTQPSPAPSPLPHPYPYLHPHPHHLQTLCPNQVGTSFAVGVTEHALQMADEHSLPCFSFNVRDAIVSKDKRSM